MFPFGNESFTSPSLRKHGIDDVIFVCRQDAVIVDQPIGFRRQADRGEHHRSGRRGNGHGELAGGRARLLLRVGRGDGVAMRTGFQNARVGVGERRAAARLSNARGDGLAVDRQLVTADTVDVIGIPGDGRLDGRGRNLDAGDRRLGGSNRKRAFRLLCGCRNNGGIRRVDRVNMLAGG